MAKAPSQSAPKPVASRGTERPLETEPLTRGGYKRLAVTERQISDTLMLDGTALVTRARLREPGEPGYLSAETLVYFIRRADRNGDRRTRDGLFRELLERCAPFFRGKFRGFSKDVREDLQGEVVKTLIEDLFAADDRGDFMQVRFWSYLERKTIDACRKAFRHNDNTESLDTGYLGDAGSEGRTKLDFQQEKSLSPEQLAILSAGLETLPRKVRQIFLMRHYLGMKIGSDNSADDDPNEITLARHFNCSGRTIRNWLKEADRLLAGF